MTASTPSTLVEQAAHDVGRGLKDTSKDPDTERAYKKLVHWRGSRLPSLVPIPLLKASIAII